MLRFILKLMLFCLLPLLTIGAIFGFSAYIGNAIPLPVVIALQKTEPVLYYAPYNRIYNYKIHSAIARQPEILALGSSRMLTFREFFFHKKPNSFYNAALMGAMPDMSISYLDEVAGKIKPKIIFWGLDQNWFNVNHSGWLGPFYRPTELLDVRFMLESTRDTVIALINGDYRLAEVLARTDPIYGVLALDARASQRGEGFRNDGSYQFGRLLIRSETSAARYAEDRADFDNRRRIYLPGDDIVTERVALIADTLARLKADGVYVIGILPPYDSEIYQEMIASGEYGYLPKAQAALQAVFDQYGYPLFDFSDGRGLGADDTTMVDTWHASERVMLAMYLQILTAEPDVLAAYSDADYLRAAHDSSHHPMEIFGYGPSGPPQRQ